LSSGTNTITLRYTKYIFIISFDIERIQYLGAFLCRILTRVVH